MTSPTEHPTSSAPPRRRFSALRFAAAVVIAALIVGYFVVAPLLVKRAIRNALHDIGEDSVAFDLDSLSFTGATLRRIELGQPQWLTARNIEVRYTPQTLLRGRVQSIEASGVRWTVRVHGGAIDPGLLFRDTTSTGGAGDMPFDRVTLADAVVDVDLDGTIQSCTASGELVRTGLGRMTGDLKLSAPDLAWSQIALSLPSAQAHADIVALDSGWRAVDARLEFSDASLRIPSHDLAINDIAGSIPYSLQGSSQNSGLITLGGIEWRGVSLPEIIANLAVEDTRIRTAVQWSPVDGAQLNGSGWLELSGPATHGTFVARVPEFELNDATLIRSLFPALAEVQMGGRYSIEASASVESGQVSPRVTINGRQIALSSSNWPGSIDNAETSITLTGFDPLTTEPDQTIFVNSARVGQTAINNGALAFTVEAIDRVSVPHVSWTMAAKSNLGRFTLNPAVINPANPRFRSTLRCEDVELGAWLELLSNGRVTGDGRLEGLVAFDFDPHRKQAVMLGNGVLEAKPQRGNVQIRDQKLVDLVLAQVQAAPGNVMEQVRDQIREQLRQRISQALNDFEYSSLQAELTSDGEDLVCELRAQGKGRSGADAQEFALIAVNVHEFNRTVRAALISQDISGRME